MRTGLSARSGEGHENQRCKPRHGNGRDQCHLGTASCLLHQMRQADSGYERPDWQDCGVQKAEEKIFPWVIEPLIYTAFATAVTAFFTWADLYNTILAAFVFACVFFGIMSEGKNSLIRRITIQTESARAAREDGVLKIEEGKDFLKNPYDNTPVFYEKDKRRKTVPVKIQFFTLSRIIKIILDVAILVFLPLLIAVIIRFFEISGKDWELMAGLRPAYGAAWYLFAGFVAIIYFAKGVRGDVYDHPILYDISNGKRKKMGSALQESSVFSPC